jgi:hypothetical protein
MKIRMTLLTAASLVMAAGCSRPPEPANNVAAPANEAGSAAVDTSLGIGNESQANLMLGMENQAAPSAGVAPDRAFVIGRWGPDGDCMQATDFHADGSATPGGKGWTLTGDRLTITRPGRPPATSRLLRTGDNTMSVTSLDGESFSLIRCQ